MTPSDAGMDGATGDRPPSGGTGRVRVRVTYGGRVMTGAQLQLAASRTMVLAGFPDSFAIVEDPVFPATGELVFATPGMYWISVNLNAPPVEFRPGAEDRVGVSTMAVDVRLGVTTDVTVDLLDRDQ
jgi:hypothetical protein